MNRFDPSIGPTAGNARSRLCARDVQVLGDDVTNFRTYIQDFMKTGAANTRNSRSRARFSATSSYFVFLGLGSTMLILYLKNLKSEAAGSIP